MPRNLPEQVHRDRSASTAAGPSADGRPADPHGITPWILGLLLVIVVVAIGLYGAGYYALPVQQRFRSPLHDELKPSGTIGHALGIVGSAMLVGMLAYSARKRIRAMHELGKLSVWLRVHIFFGIAGPLLITYHTAFKLRGIVAISYWCMIIVAISGVLGRYIYAQIPKAISGRELKHQEITRELERLHAKLAELVDPFHMRRIVAAMTFPNRVTQSSLVALIAMLRDDLVRRPRRRAQLAGILNDLHGLPHGARRRIYRAANEIELLQRRIVLLRSSRSLFKYWHVLHLPLAQTMYITMIIHILVVVSMGYF